MYVDEPPKDGNIPDFNISKIDICPFRAYQRSFRLFQGDFSTDIHQRSRLLCFTQNDHTGQTGFKICSFLKWGQTSRNKKAQSQTWLGFISYNGTFQDTHRSVSCQALSLPRSSSRCLLQLRCPQRLQFSSYLPSFVFFVDLIVSLTSWKKGKIRSMSDSILQ